MNFLGRGLKTNPKLNYAESNPYKYGRVGQLLNLVSILTPLVLGNRISQKGIDVDRGKVEVIAKIPYPIF